MTRRKNFQKSNKNSLLSKNPLQRQSRIPRRNPFLELSICLGLLVQLSFFAWWITDGQDTRYINFVSEELSIDLYSNSAETRGIYNFENKSRFSVPVTLAYPFPTQSFTVEKVIFNGERQSYIEKDSEILITARFPGNSASTLEIIYQENISNKYEYILSSTRLWKNPLENATFNIYLHDDLNIISSNYELTSIDPEVYSMNKEEFWPEDNLMLSLE